MNRHIITTPLGKYLYKQKILYLGIKPINKVQADENLKLLKKILIDCNVPFGLIYGTLLGAVREHDFITHDEDIDLFVLEENKAFFLSSLFVLRKNGFEVIRDDGRGLISIIRKGEYIDFYIFKKIKEDIRVCSGLCILDKFLTETSTILFRGETYLIPKDYEEFLRFEYGENWKTPIPYTDFKVSKFRKLIFYIKEYTKDLLPDSIYLKIKRRKEEKSINDFYCKLKGYKNN